ncbi:transcription elongation factor TFIIS-like [Nicotiana sylvestris]|uniref:Transcription elongation factor n=1 Tax=Nicotiana sylvestris TaxID=4096 RepID=A0A1U7WYM5_NICSY|nr:PREDICTED: transcription elongation factor S-II-like [Nicotiana sylvestris]XP_016450823.1 PREDICTED: transcription elongation factor TFIIS-like [Nicotiana tabacum]
MEKELIELFETVKRAADAAAVDGGADSSPEESRCVDVLKQLKKFPVNYQVLVSTQVGKRLRQLTKHPREKIQALASDVVQNWKNIIVRETLKNKNSNGVNGESVKDECPGATANEATKSQIANLVKVEKVSRVDNVKVERMTSKSDNVVKSESSFTVNAVKTEKRTVSDSIKVEKISKDGKLSSNVASVAPPKLGALIYCKDSVRDKVRELLAEALCKVSGEVDDDLRDEVNACDPNRVAVQVETAMFERWGRSNGAQKFKYRSIMFNIKDPNNPDFRRKVLIGQIPPRSITELTPEEMASEERQKQNEKIKEKALFNSERGLPAQASTDKFKCGRCRKNQCTYYQMQTRSADEPMTTYVTCVNCQNRWKFC